MLCPEPATTRVRRHGLFTLKRKEKSEAVMNLHAPSVLIFVVSLVFAGLALIGHVVLLPYVTLYGFWVAIIAYVILAVGVVMKT
jgi:hypothetical protein